MSLILALLLLIQLFPLANAPALADSSGMIRVKLSRLGTPASIAFKTSGAYTVNGTSVASGSTLVATNDGGTLVLTSGGKTLARGSSLVVNRAGTGTGYGLRFTSPSLANLFCGDLILTVSGSGILPVLRIYIETYLYGVLPFEMSNSYPLEALKAQAVAARTYAMRAKHSGGSYDVADNASSQAFRGYSSAYGNAISAVDATRGVCLISGGSYAQCYYTASNGGQTESTKNAWGSAVSYLTVKDDPYDLANPSSTVKSATISKDGGKMSSTVTNAILKAASSRLKSEGLEGASIKSVNSAQLHSPRYADPSRTYQKLKLNVTFSGSGKTASFDVDLSTYGSLESALGLSINSDNNEIISITEKSDSFVLEFRRWGHGIGLSQRGAQWMAQAHGMGYAQILDFYYPGTTRKTISLSDVVSTSSSISEPAPSPVPIETEYGYTTLQEGDTGAAVKAMQAKLKELGFFTGTPLGNYKTLTVTAVKAFQDAYGLTTDGVATPYVQKLIFEGGGTPTATPGPTETPVPTQTPHPLGYVTLQYGDTGESVKTLQRKLKELGFFTGNIGGNYLSLTQTAVESYQKARGLQADGIATPELQEKLFGESSGKPTDVPADAAQSTPAPTPASAEQTAVVSVNGRLNVRQGATTSSAVLGTLTDGTTVTVTGASGAWSAIRAGSLSGYVMTSFLKMQPKATEVPAPQPQTTPEPSDGDAPQWAAVSVDGRLNIRQEPNTNCRIVGTLSNGDIVAITGVSGSWSKIQAGQRTGYVMTRFLVSTSSPAVMPTQAPAATGQEESSGYSTLQYGDTGDAVKALQRKLKELGYFSGNIGGNYLSLTQEAVQSYQKAKGLTADGIATSDLQKRIFAENVDAPKPTDPPKTDEPKDTGMIMYITLGNPSERVNVRKSPSTSSAILGTLKHGSSVTVTGTSGSWSAITSGSLTGYVMSSFLSSVQPAASSDAAPQQGAAPAKPSATETPSSGYRTLQHGDTGDPVKALQRKLKELGYFTGNIGGNYLSLTESAVKAFQEAHGLTADGIATPELQKMIFAAN